MRLCFLVCPFATSLLPNAMKVTRTRHYLGSLVRETCPVTTSCCSPVLGACGKQGSRSTQKSSGEPPAPAADGSSVNQLWTLIPLSLKASVPSWFLIRPEGCEGISTAAAGRNAAEWHPGQRAGLRKFWRENLADAVFRATVSNSLLSDRNTSFFPDSKDSINLIPEQYNLWLETVPDVGIYSKACI